MRRLTSPRTLVTLVSVVVLALLAPPAATASDAAAAGPLAIDGASVSQPVHIRTYNTGNRCLNAEGGRSANGTGIILWDCTRFWNDHWQLARPAGANYYYIFVTDPDGKRRCLNAWFGGIDNFTPIVLWDCAATWNNVWYLDEGSSVDGVYFIKTANTLHRCVNARANGSANGTDIILYDCVGSRNNMWF